MSYRIEYSPIAIRDLDRVWAEVYEASKSEEITLQYVDGLMDKISDKRDFPRSGSPLYYEGSFTGYYYVVFKSYLAFYHVKDDLVFVDRVVYSKSDYIRTIFRRTDL